MARGTNAKAEVTKKILDTFNGSFLYNDGKEIRIPMLDEAEVVQIKVALTCAKDNVNPGDDNAIPGEGDTFTVTDNGIMATHTITKEEAGVTIEPTQAELDNVNDLLRALGL